MEALVSFVTTHLTGLLSKDAIVFIISLMPILELRGGLLASSLLGVPYLRALILCIVGNLLPIPLILLFIEKIVLACEHFGPTQGIARKLREKVEKNHASIQKYDFWGLVLFVGIPLPGTGAWTGSIVASLLHMPRKKSFLAIIIGVLLASVIMSIVSYGVLGAFLH